jgi:hypothetical protein
LPFVQQGSPYAGCGELHASCEALIASERYRSAELIFGWSFYRQGTSGQSASADEFLEVALAWFGDPSPRIGTA